MKRGVSTEALVYIHHYSTQEMVAIFNIYLLTALEYDYMLQIPCVQVGSNKL